MVLIALMQMIYLTFVPFADLTNDTVTGWVTAGMGDDEVASLKSGLDASNRITDYTNICY